MEVFPQGHESRSKGRVESMAADNLISTENSTASRERLANSLNHKQPDRIPIDFGGTSVTGIHVSCVAALRDFYGLEKRLVRIHEPGQMLALVDDDLKDAMGL